MWRSTSPCSPYRTLTPTLLQCRWIIREMRLPPAITIVLSAPGRLGFGRWPLWAALSDWREKEEVGLFAVSGTGGGVPRAEWSWARASEAEQRAPAWNVRNEESDRDCLLFSLAGAGPGGPLAEGGFRPCHPAKTGGDAGDWRAGRRS